MQDMRKTKAQLVEELEQLRQRVRQLESGEHDNALAQSERRNRRRPHVMSGGALPEGLEPDNHGTLAQCSKHLTQRW
jgi:hypothetical protein